jgi:GAF domain-containing protein
MSGTPNLLTSHGASPAGASTRQVAIVGLNRETANLLPSLMEAEGIQVIKILNPELEDLSRLTQYPHLDIIIDTTHNATTAARLRKLPLKRVDVISGMGARILFCAAGAAHAHRENGPDKGRILHNLEEIREAVCLTKNKDEILKVILNTAVKASGADSGSVMLLDPSKKQLTIEAALGLDEGIMISSVQRVGKGVAGSAIRKGEPLLIQGKVDKLAYAADYDKPEIVSSICCPLMFGEEALGVINIASKNPARVFDGRDVDFLRDLARLTAEVIKTSKEGEATQQTANNTGLLNNVREILSMKYRFEERLNLLLMKMANAFSAKVCNYYEFRPDDKTFLAKASSSLGVNVLRDKPMFLDDFFAQRVMKTHNTFCVNGTGRAAREKKWYILQPIRVGHELAGALFVQLHTEKNILKEETLLLKKIGDMLTREVGKNRELESIKAQSLKYSAISQFSFDVANAKTLPDLSRMILSNVRLILETDTCVLRLRNSSSEPLEVNGSLSHKNPLWLKDILALDEIIISDIKPGKGAVLFTDLRQSPYQMDNLGSESALVVGLEMGGDILGTLTLYDKKSLDPAGGKNFTEEDREILLNFALQASKALSRFRPFPGKVKTSESSAGEPSEAAEAEDRSWKPGAPALDSKESEPPALDPKESELKS